MEIEKKRETSWKIELKKKTNYIELTSVEISGEIRKIKLELMNEDSSSKVEMNKEEFLNFLSLISAFKDVIIGETALELGDNSGQIKESKPQEIEKISNVNTDIYQFNANHSKNNVEEDENQESLNPEEWDPW